MVEVEWRIDNIFHLESKVPKGVTATVKLPDNYRANVTRRRGLQYKHL